MELNEVQRYMVVERIALAMRRPGRERSARE